MASLLRWLLSLVFKYTNKTSIVSDGLQDHLNFRFCSPLDLLVIREPKLISHFWIYRLLQLSIRASFPGLHKSEQDVHCIGCVLMVLTTMKFLKMINFTLLEILGNSKLECPISLPVTHFLLRRFCLVDIWKLKTLRSSYFSVFYQWS